jgi:hypothetical protein
MFIAKRSGFMNKKLYYIEDTSWSEERDKAKKFNTKQEALSESDRQKLYEVSVEEV